MSRDVEYTNTDAIVDGELRLVHFKCSPDEDSDEKDHVNVTCKYSVKIGDIVIVHETNDSLDLNDASDQYIKKIKAVRKQGIFVLGTDHSNDDFVDRTNVTIPFDKCMTALTKSHDLMKSYLTAVKN